jgi:A/G-specific adenine glycosylase
MPAAKTFSPQEVRSFRQSLLSWFDREQRKLPWRGARDPYCILVSEIMLQQTRVAVVEQRYAGFVRQFPTARRLAAAREQTVLAAWSGMGYYRRARSLHAAAKKVSGNGGFPRTAEALHELPGIGRYTAAAVASIAFDEPAAAVDGNVKRVLTRLVGNPLNESGYWDTASKLLDPKRPGDFNQSMMELGATVCLPGKPLCERCPVATLCVEQGAGAKRKQAPRNKAELRYSLVLKDEKVLLRQRPKTSSLMAGMWELPEIQAKKASGVPRLRLKHSITNTDYTVLVFSSRLHKSAAGRFVTASVAAKMALTGLAKKILQRAEFLRH